MGNIFVVGACTAGKLGKVASFWVKYLRSYLQPRKPRIFCPRGQNICGGSAILRHFVGQNIRGCRGWSSDHEYFTHEWSDLAYLYLQWKQQNPNPNILPPEIFVGQNIRGFRGWRSDHECLPTNESDLAYFYLQWKQQPQIFCPPKFSWGKIFVVFVVEGLTTNIYPQMKATLPTFTCSESSNHKYFAPKNFRGAKYSWFSWLKVWPRMFYPQMKATLPTFTCSESSNHKYFAPRNFRGAKYSWFSWLKVWPRIYYPRMKQPCLPLPAVKAATTNILPPKFSWGKIFVVFVVEGLTTNVYPQMKATLPTFTCSESSNHKYFAPEIFVGQNIRGFRGWRSDHEYFTTNEATLPTFTCSESSNHKYFAPEIFVGQNIRGFRGWRSDHEYLTNESDLAYFYLQWKQQPQIFCPPKFSWGKIFVVFVVEGLTTNVYPQMKRPCLLLPAVKAATTNILPPEIFMGQNIRGFRGWRSDHECFTHKWRDFAYFYLQMKQQPQIFCPPKFSWGKIFFVFVVEGLTTNVYPQMKATLPTFTCSESSNHKYFAPEIFVGQNIRGFRGWRSDHECLPTNESDLADLYLQWKQQPQIFCPRNFRGAKYSWFSWLKVWPRIHKWSDLADLYLQWKQQPQIFCPPKFSWGKIFVVFVVEGLTTNVYPQMKATLPTFTCSESSNHKYFAPRNFREIFVVEGLTTNIYPQMKATLPTFTCSWKQQPQIFCPRNFRGAKYSCFLWLKV